MRKIIISASGGLFLLISILLYNYLLESKSTSEPVLNKIKKQVDVQRVQNGTIPIVIKANGSLRAKNRLEIYSEVQGILERSKKDYKAGVSYQKSETLLSINSKEYYASLQSRRSELQNKMVAIMPDLRLDYPASYEKWKNYLDNFDLNEMLRDLPETHSSQEEYFLVGKEIYSLYYEIKNLETHFLKYQIKVPFHGILTEALVTQGSLVRSGQKLGEFIDPSVFELQISISSYLADFLQLNEEVKVQNLEGDRIWTGHLSRINGKIDQESQTVEIFIELKGKGLREGMYLEALISSREEQNVFELDRSLLVDNKAVYVVENHALKLVKIHPVYFSEKTVLLRGLKNGDLLVSKPVIGAYSGMPVKVVMPDIQE